MPSEYLHSGEPLPLAPTLSGEYETDVTELVVFNNKLLDYLRRLGAKLSNPTFIPSTASDLETLCLYRNTTTASLLAATGDQDIPWDGQIRVDAPYTHDAAGSDPGHILFNSDGFYLMMVDLRPSATNSFNTKLVDPGNSDQILSWSLGDCASPIALRPYHQTIPFHAHAGQSLALQIDPYGGNNTLILDETRLVVIKLGAILGGGEDPIDGCVLEPWQLWC